MGDRSNVCIVQHRGKEVSGRIYIYSHWGGEQIASDLQAALKKRWRWDDEAYLTRIIYDHIVGESFKTETGFGIATYLCDNEHPILVVDAHEQKIYLENESGARYEGKVWTFEEFIGLDLDNLDHSPYRDE